MPNHVHGIIYLKPKQRRDTSHTSQNKKIRKQTDTVRLYTRLEIPIIKINSVPNGIIFLRSFEDSNLPVPEKLLTTEQRILVGNPNFMITLSERILNGGIKTSITAKNKSNYV